MRSGDTVRDAAMNLYLSSYMIGNHADRLLAMAGGRGARMAVVTNALDHISLEEQLAFHRSTFDPESYFADYGFDPYLLDLRRFFGRTDALRRALLRHKVIWALGGNAFLLRRAMRESGFDEIVRDVLDDGVIYAGWSAGACVAGDSLRAVGLMDEPEVTAPGYADGDVVWEGLGFVPFTILPHHESDHSEAGSAARAAAWARDRRIEHRALRDGEVLLVDDGGEPVLLPRNG